LLQHEKMSRERRERELAWKMKESAEELTKMKSLSIELIEERQKQLHQFTEQRQQAVDLQTTVEDLKVKIQQMEVERSNEREHSNQLENDLEEQTNKHLREVESLNEQLKAEQQNEKQLKEQVSTQKRRIKHLQAMDKSLRKTDDQLLRIQENLTSDKLFEEIASLRNTMNDMENAEVVYNQASEESRELRDQLNQEIELTRKLKTEVEKMKTSFKSQVELERMVEDSTFKMEEVQNLLEAEKRKNEKLRGKFEAFSLHVENFKQVEDMLDHTQDQLEQMIHENEQLKIERNLAHTQLEEADEKCDNCHQLLEEERLKVAEAKQKQITESRECLRLKEELKKLTSSHTEEKNAMQNHIDSLTAPQNDTSGDNDEDKLNLRRQISALQERLNASEERSKQLESIKSDLESDVQITKARLVQSTGKLKDLVTSGINEQLAVVKCEEYSNKIKELETENEILRTSLHKAHSKTNTNTNNLADLQIAEKLVTNLTNGISIQSYKPPPACDLQSYKPPPACDLRPPSSQSVRHAALKKTSSIQEKRSSCEKKSMNRTSSLKSLRRTLSGSQGNIEGRPPVAEGRPQEGRPPSSKSSFTSSTSSVVSQSPRQERSRSIVKKKNSTSSSDGSTKPPSSKQKLSKIRNKSLTRMANFIRPASAMSSFSSSTKKEEKSPKTKSGIPKPKPRSSTPTSSASKKNKKSKKK